ncbi:MAG: hypothetical protein JW910_05915 [Anaerolineae bacterium]|nr:hypothetical protein [Anaerolineae bacterium]
MTAQPTVHVEPIPGCPALKMTWQQHVRDEDVKTAFEDIIAALEAREAPLFVIVDLLSNPRFPLRTTVQEASSAYRDRRLAAWLIVGSNWMARMVEGSLSRLTGRHNVYWYESEAEALAALEEMDHTPVT